MNTTEPKTVLEQFTVVKRGISYRRVSTEEQAASGTSLLSQTKAIEAYTAKNDIQLVADFYDDYTGSTLDRPGLTEARQFLKAVKADCIVIYDSDRLSRNPLDYMTLRDEFQELGIELHYTTRGRIDLNSDEQMMMEDLQGRFAHKWKKKLVELTTTGRRERSMAGLVMVVRPSFGYTVKKEIEMLPNGRVIIKSRSLEIEPAEAEIIRLIFYLYVVEDYSISAIADYLSKKKYPTRGDKGGNYLKEREAGEWGQSTVARILENQVYCGTLYYGGVPVTVSPIVDKALWEEAQEKRAKVQEFMTRRNKHEYLLSGRVICGVCKQHMTGTASVSSGYSYYRCNTAKGLKVGLCSNRHHFRASKVDDAVIGWLGEVMSDKKKLAEGLQQYKKEQARKYAPLIEELKRVTKKVDEKRAQLNRLLDLYLEGGLPKNLFIDRQRALEADVNDGEKRKAEIEKELNIVTLTPERIKTIHQFAAKISRGFSKLKNNPKAQRQLVAVLDVQVTLEKLGKGMKIHISCACGSEGITLDEDGIRLANTSFSRYSHKSNFRLSVTLVIN